MRHHPAAFINALAEEGTKDEAIAHLQRVWNELCEARARIRELEKLAENGPSLPYHYVPS